MFIHLLGKLNSVERRVVGMNGIAITGAGVCIVGNLNMDLLIRGVGALPEWGQEVVGVSHQLFPAGQAGYCALALAALEQPVSVIGVVGDDAEGDEIVRVLTDAGADVNGVVSLSGEQTGLTVALVRPDGERAFASNVGCSGRLTGEMLRAATADLGSSGIVGLVGLFMMAGLEIADAVEFLKRCRREGRTTMLDTGWDPENWRPETVEALHPLLSEVDLFLPNLDEAQAITGQQKPEHALALLSDICPGTIVIKCGAEGSVTWHQGRMVHHSAIATDAIDAVGAGDVFDAGLMAALQRGAPIAEALELAHATASIYVSRTTGRYPDLTEVNALLALIKSSEKERGATL